MKQSVTAVLIALAATLAVSWNRASGAKPAPGFDESLTQVRRAVSPQAFDISSARELTACIPDNQDSPLDYFAANTSNISLYLLTGGESDKRIIASEARCIN